MQTIVAPTDFSATSLNAVDYAADLACAIGTNLSLVHVCQLPVATTEVPVTEYCITELITDAENEMVVLKEKLMRRTGERINIITEVREGETTPELDTYCSSVNTYAVVMGTERTSPIERTLFGGTTIGAMRKLLWPLIVVPPDVKFSGIKKIGLACDLEQVVETLPINEISRVVKELHADFHVLHINTKEQDTLDTEPMEELGWLKELLDGLLPKYHFLKDKDIEKGIAEFAEQNQLDLLIVIQKKHSLFHRLLQHSHSQRLVLHTRVPVCRLWLCMHK